MKGIKLLRDYLKEMPEVIMGFLFGSRIKSKTRNVSDWDIALFLIRNDLSLKNKIWQDLENLLKKEVDLVILNEAPPILANSILSSGKVLVIKDRSKYLELLIKISEESESFRQFTNDYYEIYQRSISLTETDRARIKRIITFLEAEMRDYQKFSKLTFENYKSNVSIGREVERWVENLINSVLDIAKIILASHKKPLPDTYRGIILEFKTFAEFKQGKICEKLASWVKLRNILAHEYLDIRWENIENFLKESQPYLVGFLKEIKSLIK